MSDLPRELADARDRIGAPDAAATERARRAAVGAVRALGPGGPGRRRRLLRPALVGVVAVALTGGLAFAGGFVAGSSERSPDDVPGAGFLPARGWNTYQTDLAATAAQVPLGPDVFSGTFPWETIARLGDGEVLVQAQFLPAGERAAVDAQFPDRELPLTLADAHEGGFEGQPAGVTLYRLLARANGVNVDLFVFFGGEPTSDARAAAEEQLARLMIPSGPPAPPVTSAAARPDACRAENLRARVDLGSGGDGAIVFANAGPECTLSGRPAVELRDVNGVLVEAASSDAPAAWERAGSEQPPGWPTAQLAPGAGAQARLALENWCRRSDERISVQIRVPGDSTPVLTWARPAQACEQSGMPVSIRIGPFEPLREPPG